MPGFRSTLTFLASKPQVKFGSGKALCSTPAKALTTTSRFLTTTGFAGKSKSKPRSLDDFFDSLLGKKIFFFVKQGNSDIETKRQIARYVKWLEEREERRRNIALTRLQ